MDKINKFSDYSCYSGESIIGWTVAYYNEVIPVLVELFIPEDAKREFKSDKLYIANKAITRWISDGYQWHGENMNYKEAYSFDRSIHYTLGKEIINEYDGPNNNEITFYLDMNVAKEKI